MVAGLFFVLQMVACGAMAIMLANPAQATVPNDNFSSDGILDTAGGNPTNTDAGVANPNFCTTNIANFVGGPAIGRTPFALGVGQDRDWVELSAGIQITTGSVDLDIAADTTVWRNDVRNQSYRASATFRF